MPSKIKSLKNQEHSLRRRKIAQGAEAIISEQKILYSAPSHTKSSRRTSSKKVIPHNSKVIILKERFEKKYRTAELDKSLRQFRTRREAKILQKLEEVDFPAPRLIDSNDKTMIITMSKIVGIKLRDHLMNTKYTSSIGKQIGTLVSTLHNLNIIHQDLTTSNMIQSEKSIYLIDYGLSFFSDRDEDKAVDLYLLERAIQSTHSTLYPKMWDDIIAGYHKSSVSTGVLKRLEQVKSRGRNKKK